MLVGDLNAGETLIKAGFSADVGGHTYALGKPRPCSRLRDCPKEEGMPKYTIGLLELKVIHTLTDEEVHPSNFGPQEKDVLDDWSGYLKKIAQEGGVSRQERFLAVESRVDIVTSREIVCEIDYGHFGSHRRVRNVDNGAHISDIDLNEVPGDPLRLLLRSPINGTFAFMAHEMVGRSSCAGLLIPEFKSWFAKANSGYRLEVNYVEDSDAWNEFLDGASLRELTFTARRTSEANRAGRPTKERYDILPGRRGDVLPQSWLQRLRCDGLPASEVLSVPVADEDIDETKVVVEKEGRRRTIRIGDDWPRFTWEIDPKAKSRPDDALYFDVARQIIDGQLRRLRIDG